MIEVEVDFESCFMFNVFIITVPNSFVVIVPSPSLSNKENASLNSRRFKKCDLGGRGKIFSIENEKICK